jgi:hypothetical protein
MCFTMPGDNTLPDLTISLDGHCRPAGVLGSTFTVQGALMASLALRLITVGGGVADFGWAAISICSAYIAFFLSQDQSRSCLAFSMPCFRREI